MSILAVLVTAASVDDLLNQGKDLLKAKNYEKAIGVFSQAIETGSAPATAYYFRGNAYDSQLRPREALEDYKRVIDLTERSKNVHERSQKRFADICRQYCQLNCARNYSVKYFPSARQFNELKGLQERRRFLLSNNVELSQVQEFAQTCSRDPQLQLKVLQAALEDGKFELARGTLQSLRQVFPGYRFEIQAAVDSLQLVDYLGQEAYAELEALAQKVIQGAPDEPAFGQLLKLARGLREAFAVFEGLTPGSAKGGAAQVAGAAEKLSRLPDLGRLFSRLEAKVQSLLAQVFKEDNADLRLSLRGVQAAVEAQIGALRGAADFFAGKSAELSGEIEAPATPSSKYLKALLLSVQLQQEVRALSRAYNRGQDVAEEIEAADKRVSQIHTLIQEAVQGRSSGKQFLNAEKFVDEVNLLSDKVFALYQKAMTPNFYEALNVTRQATTSEIKKNYFKLARKLHPDTVPKDTPEDEKKRIAAQFQKVAEAWDVLGDDEKRRQYDAGQYNQEAKAQKQANHQQRKERAKMLVQNGGQQPQMGGFGGFGGGQQFFFNGDPFDMFRQFGFGGGQQGGQQGGQRQHFRINFNGQEFFM